VATPRAQSSADLEKKKDEQKTPHTAIREIRYANLAAQLESRKRE
jgi:hypothetical protein